MLQVGFLVLLAPVVDVFLNFFFVVDYYARQFSLLVVLVGHDWMEIFEGLLHAVEGLDIAQIRGILTGFFVSGNLIESVFTGK